MVHVLTDQAGNEISVPRDGWMGWFLLVLLHLESLPCTPTLPGQTFLLFFNGLLFSFWLSKRFNIYHTCAEEDAG